MQDCGFYYADPRRERPQGATSGKRRQDPKGLAGFAKGETAGGKIKDFSAAPDTAQPSAAAYPRGSEAVAGATVREDEKLSR